jgi:hypothetical protein
MSGEVEMKPSFALTACVAVLLVFGWTAPGRAQEVTSGEATLPRVDPCRMTTTRSYANFIQPGWSDGPRHGTFKVISDPQYPRVVKEDGTEGDDQKASDEILTDWFTAVGEGRPHDQYMPVFLNGDITEFGHNWQREKIQALFPLMHGPKPGPLFLPGLGNHDYANNVGQCTNNGCARDSICDMVTWINEILPTAGSPKYFDFKYSEDQYRGSLSYAFTYGRIFFIQLHDSPVYSRTFKSLVEGLHGEATFRIDPSLRWLEGVLREARREGLVIFINMHKVDDWPNDASAERFKLLVQSYGVSAAFGGHYHKVFGNYNGATEKFGDIPVFQAGAVFRKNMLIVGYDIDKMKAQVWALSPGGIPLIREFPLKGGRELPPVIDDFSDAEITLYEGNNATQKAVCDVMIGNHPKFNLGSGHACPNDEARSMVIHKAKRGTLIQVFGNYNFNGDQGYATIEVTDDILLPITINTFQNNYDGAKFKIRKFGPDTLDGKISSLSVEPINFENGSITLFEANNFGQNVVCTESVAKDRSYNMGGKCANDEARSAILYRVKQGTNVCYYGDWDQKEGQGYTCIKVWKNHTTLPVGTFDQNVTVPGEYQIYHYGDAVDGKISSTRVRHLPVPTDDAHALPTE